MLNAGSAVRVIIHLNEDIGSRTDYLHNEVVAFLYSNGVSGASVFRPVAGFGLHHRLHVQGAAGEHGGHLPIRVEFIESKAMMEMLLPKLYELVTDGVIEVQETTILRVTRSPQEYPFRGEIKG